MGDRAAAIRFFNQAVDTINDKSKPSNPTTAFNLFSAACAVDPQWGHAWFQYAANVGGLDWLHTAIAAYHKALQYETDDAERVKAYCDMGWRMFTVGKFNEATEAIKKSLELDQKCDPAWVNMAQIHGLRSENEEALECARKGYELAPDNVINEAALAFALLFSRRLKEGFKHFEVRFPWRLHQYQQLPYPKWEGEPDKVVYLAADQGLGDTLCFARFVEKAAKKAKYLHVHIQPPLMRLFMHAFIGIKNLNLMPQGQSYPQADVWTTFVSLPYVLGLDDKEIRNTSQIKPPIFHLPTSWVIPDQKLHVGICWKGSAKNDIDQHRSIPARHFLELCKVPGVQLYSLQVGEGVDDLNNMGAGALVRPLSPYISDVCDTVSLLQNLDLVIGCESAVGHICSMVGKEFWMAYGYMAPDYRIGHDAKDVLWAPRHRVFKQGEDCRWEPVFERLVEALDKRVRSKSHDRRRVLQHA
jgi:hypothetical protein